MTTFAASVANTAAAHVVDVPETFVEEHTAAIAHLQAFVHAVEHYTPGVPGTNTALQEAMRALRVPSTVNMGNAVQWAHNAIAAEEKALALEMQKESALSALKAAERHRRDAERLAQRARKAWAALSTPVNAAVVQHGTPLRKNRACNASRLSVAA